MGVGKAAAGAVIGILALNYLSTISKAGKAVVAIEPCQFRIAGLKTWYDDDQLLFQEVIEEVSTELDGMIPEREVWTPHSLLEKFFKRHKAECSFIKLHRSLKTLKMQHVTQQFLDLAEQRLARSQP